MNLHLKLATHIFFLFGTIEHQICWWPPYLHIEYKLNWRRAICLNLNSLPHFFPFWWWAFLSRSERWYFSCAKYQHIPWLQLPLPTLPHRGMLVHVQLAALGRNAVTCYRSRWASVLLDWLHARDSCHLWLTEITALSLWTDAPKFSLLPIVLLACSSLQLWGKFFHHRHVVACIVASDVANLHSSR